MTKSEVRFFTALIIGAARLGLLLPRRLEALPMIRPWPRIYRTTIIDRRQMDLEELEILWAEYRAYWAGRESHSNPTLQAEYQKDRDEDKQGDFR